MAKIRNHKVSHNTDQHHSVLHINKSSNRTSPGPPTTTTGIDSRLVLKPVLSNATSHIYTSPFITPTYRNRMTNTQHVTYRTLPPCPVTTPSMYPISPFSSSLHNTPNSVLTRAAPGTAYQPRSRPQVFNYWYWLSKSRGQCKKSSAPKVIPFGCKDLRS